MFDANAAYIPVGEKFFAEVHSIDRQLESAGIKCGDIVLCEHVLKSNESARENLVSKVWASINQAPIEWNVPDDIREWSWLVYSGKPNGKGFIQDEWKQKAVDFLGGQWQE